MSKPEIAWSYSRISAFENCPRKFWELNIAKSIPYVQGDEAKDGDLQHKEFEAYFKMGKPLSEINVPFQPLLDKFKALPGEQYVETDLTLRKDFVPCKTNDWNNAWFRNRADYVKVNGHHALSVDWKFGKPRDDEQQGELTALSIFQYHEKVTSVTFLYAFLRHNQVLPHTFYRANIARMWGGWLEKVKKLEAAVKKNEWPATPNPLCGWCPVKKCPHNKNPKA